MKRATPAALLATVILLAGCGASSGPLTAVQRCTAAYQAYVSDGLNGQTDAAIKAYGSAHDKQVLAAAHAACDGLTAAQAKQAGENVQP